MRTSLIAYCVAVLLAIVQLWWQIPRLPERVATHFGPNGVADGWSSRTTFAWFSVILAASFALLPLLVRVLLRVLPTQLINLPRRDFWLAEDRRESTLRRIGSWMEWYGAISVLFAMGITHLTTRANLAAASPEEAQLGSDFMWLLVLYMAFTAVWVALIYRDFRRPPSRETVEPV